MFLKHILEIFALFMLTGVFSTLLLPETKGLSLEDLSQEDQSHFIGGGASTNGSDADESPKERL